MGWCRLQSALVVVLLCLNGLALIPHFLAQSNPQDYIDAHNTVRAQVGVGPMTWDNEVAEYAHKYGTQRVGDCNLVHSGGPYGENLAIGGAGTDAINMWVSEKPYYDYSSNSCKGDECHHYTQVVWRDSVRLGCARLKCNKEDEEYFVICSYDPPGNYEGQRPY
ncbi:basic form of pathogenesis-related protein 1-like [Telopea speciosissima]|uniref:basic form of pathogenesis-related protein 1-like n=1 Tax=Telopea speciosissima TaxID=54955 RepID=UPI001CC7F732|nr:basic form of pathogenesis-related protein 1-like [Telopea speciosissima]